MKFLITGSDGQLGSELRLISKKNKNHKWFFSDIKDLNFTDLKKINFYLEKINPTLIINCAAYTNVDKAESEPKLAELINYKAIESISKWCFTNKAKLIHISTDYVFDGKSSIPLSEKAPTNPLNVYGLTKLKGEQVCFKNNPNSIIIRTSWLYSSFGKNFVKTISSLMKKNSSLKIINDQIGSPTYAKDLAETIITIIKYKDWIPGLYHYSNEGRASWYDFALDIKKTFGFKTNLEGVSSDHYPTLAKRPKFSLLDKSKIKKTFNIIVPNYEESLKNCIKILKK